MSESATIALEGNKRTLVGPVVTLVTLVSIAAAIFHIYALGISSPGVMNLRGLHLLLAFILVPLLYAGWAGSRGKPHWMDYGLVLCGIAATSYFLIEGPNMMWRYGVAPTPYDLLFGGLTIMLILETTRRAIGWPLVIIVVLMILYALFGEMAPGLLQSRSFSLRRVVSFLFSMDGIYGIPLGVSSTYVYLFILFGALLQLSRTGDFYMNLAYSVAGRTRGGPAKVSVFASALFGTISGSGIANVVTTGTMTIPLMKRAGFKPLFAAAVESVSSTGGQLIPPIMGAGAFLMAEFTGIPYSSIVIAATLPALLFFMSVFLIVDIESAKQGMKGMKKSELPRWLDVMREWGHLSIPLLVLVYMLIIEGSSPIRAVLFAMGTTFIVSWLRVQSRLGWRRLIEAAVRGSQGALEVIVACASAGIIVGLFSLTGIGVRLSSVVLTMSDGIVLVALLLSAVVTIILSMGLPATAAYIVAASVIPGALTDLGVSALSAHLFIFYFACLSGITPPVALVAFPAGSIAGVNPFSVGILAFRLAIVAFMIPFMFVYAPALLMDGTLPEVVIATVTAVIGIWAFAGALGGWLMGREMAVWLRIPFGIAAIVTVLPGITTDVIGLATMAIIVFWQRQWRPAHQTGP